MIKVFLVSKSYHFTSIPCIFQTNFQIPVYIGICKEKDGPRVAASFSNSIRYFVNDGLVLTYLCLNAFLLK